MPEHEWREGERRLKVTEEKAFEHDDTRPKRNPWRSYGRLSWTSKLFVREILRLSRIADTYFTENRELLRALRVLVPELLRLAGDPAEPSSESVRDLLTKAGVLADGALDSWPLARKIIASEPSLEEDLHHWHMEMARRFGPQRALELAYEAAGFTPERSRVLAAQHGDFHVFNYPLMSRPR